MKRQPSCLTQPLIGGRAKGGIPPRQDSWSERHVDRRSFLAAASAVALAPAAGRAQSAQITGAGATFPARSTSDGARRRASAHRHAAELPVDRLGRRHQPDHATAPWISAPPTRRSPRTQLQQAQPAPVPDRDGLGGADREPPGRRRTTQLKLTRRRCWPTSTSASITRWNDPQLAEHEPRRRACRTWPLRRSTGPTARARPSSSPPTSPRVSPEWKRRPGRRAPPCAGRSARARAATRAWPARCGTRRGAIGYVENAYATRNRLVTTQLRNKAGSFVKPTHGELHRRGRATPTGSVPDFAADPDRPGRRRPPGRSSRPPSSCCRPTRRTRRR